MHEQGRNGSEASPQPEGSNQGWPAPEEFATDQPNQPTPPEIDSHTIEPVRRIRVPHSSEPVFRAWLDEQVS